MTRERPDRITTDADIREWIVSQWSYGRLTPGKDGLLKAEHDNSMLNERILINPEKKNYGV